MNARKLEFEAARAGLLRVFPPNHLFTIDDVATIISLAASSPSHDTPEGTRTASTHDTPPAAPST